MMETERQQFIGRMIMQILDLYSEGKVPLPPADVIAARAAYLCGVYDMSVNPGMKGSFTSRRQRERTRY